MLLVVLLAFGGVLLVVGSASGVGLAAGQDDMTPGPTETAEPTPTPTADGPTALEDNATAVIAVDDAVTVMAYAYDRKAGEMVVILEADTIRQVEVADVYGAIEESGGARSIPSRELEVPPGRSRVRIPAEPADGRVVVTVGTSDGAVALTATTGTALLHGSPTWDDVRMGTVLGAAAALVAVVFIAYRRQLGKSGDVERGPL